MEGTKFQEGDLALLIDRKKRRYLIQLKKDKSFHTHIGIISHNEILEHLIGSEIASSQGGVFQAFKPTLTDYIYEMQRGPQVIYPKDLSAILLMADIYPGVKVFESGVGSGALAMTLLQSGAEVVGYEIREDHLERALQNMEGFLGKDFVQEKYAIYQKNAYEGIEHDNFDRIILDLPEPWEVVPHIPSVLKPGGIVLAYTPAITQASRFIEALSTQETKGYFAAPQTLEVLNREWHIEGKSIRPNHRMVAHTGFLTRVLMLAK